MLNWLVKTWGFDTDNGETDPRFEFECSASTFNGKSNTAIGDIYLSGDDLYGMPEPDFSNKCNTALGILKVRASEDCAFVCEHIKAIRAAAESNVCVYTGAFNLGYGTFAGSIEWLASAIAHEAYHVWLYKSGKEFYGQNAEIQCNAYQSGVLEKVGGSPWEVQALLDQDGTHYLQTITW